MHSDWVGTHGGRLEVQLSGRIEKARDKLGEERERGGKMESGGRMAVTGVVGVHCFRVSAVTCAPLRLVPPSLPRGAVVDVCPTLSCQVALIF